MSTYSVRVLRTFQEDYIDLEVEARSKKEAATKALVEAEWNASLLFDDTPEPKYVVDPSMDPEKIA